MTQGKCIKCRVKFEWYNRQRLADSYCIYCGKKLLQTSTMLHTLADSPNGYRELKGITPNTFDTVEHDRLLKLKHILTEI